MSNFVFRIRNDLVSRSFPASNLGGPIPDPLTLDEIIVDELTINQILNAPVGDTTVVTPGPKGSIIIDVNSCLLYLSDGVNWNLLANPTLDVKQSVRVRATVTDIPVGTYTASGSGIGKTLTANPPAALPNIDGVVLLVGDRLIVDIGNPLGNPDANNGIYEVTSLGPPWILTRTQDADENGEITDGTFAFVQEGVVSGDEGFIVTTNDPIIIDTTPIQWRQFTGAGDNLGNHIATMNLDMSTFDIDNVDHIYGTGVSGTSLDPTYSFTGDATSGMYAPVVGEVRISAGGTDHLRLANNQVLAGQFGTVGNPAFAFSGDPNVGLYRSNADEISIAAGNFQRYIFSTTNMTLTNVNGILNVEGTAAIPSYSFASDTNTGMYLESPNTLGLSASGSQIARFDSTGLDLNASGSEAIPVITLGTATSTGFFRGVGDQIGITAASTERGLWSTGGLHIAPGGVGGTPVDLTAALELTSTTKGFLPSRMTTVQRDAIGAPATGLQIYNTTTGTMQYYDGVAWNDMAADDLGDHIATMNLNMSSFDIIGIDQTFAGLGSVTDPSYTFTSDPDTGMYALPAGNQLAFAAGGGIPRMTIGEFVILFTEPVRGPDGSAGSPTYSFSADANTGMYRNGPDQLSFSTGIGGNERLRIQNGNIFVRRQLQAETAIGGAGAPNYSFDNNSDSGMFSFSPGYLNFSWSGVEKIRCGPAATGVAIDIGGVASNADASSVLDLRSTTQGFLPPRMTTAERDLIGAPVAGLQIYNTTASSMQYYDGATWKSF